MDTRRLGRGALAAGLSMLTFGCSTYQGRHLKPGEELPLHGSGASGPFAAGGGAGIPYSLPRPEFTLQRTVANGKAQYLVAHGYVPDPDHRYTLRVDPSWLASVGFDFDLGEQGQVTSVGLKQVDQVVPTITAVGALIAAAVVSPVPFFSGRLRARSDRAAIQPALPSVCRKVETDRDPRGPEDSLACRFARPLAPPGRFPCLTEPEPDKEERDRGREAGHSLVSFAQRYILDAFGRPLVEINDAGLRGDLHPRSGHERACLREFHEAQRLGDDGTEFGVGPAVARLVAAFAAVDLSTANDLRDRLAPELAKRLRDPGPGPLAGLRDAARQALAGRPGALAKLVELTAPPEATREADLRRLARAVLVAVDPGPSPPDLERFLGKGVPGPMAETWLDLWKAGANRRAEVNLEAMLATTLTLDLAEWRARHLRHLDRRIEEIGRALALAGPPASPDPLAVPAGGGEVPRTCPPESPILKGEGEPEEPAISQDDLARCREERAWTIGEYDTLHRLRALDAQLDDIRPPAPGDEASYYQEYARVRAERELLQARLDAAAAKVAEKAAPPGVEPFEPKPVLVVEQACVDGGPGAEGCDTAEAWPPEADDAEFVITLTKLGPAEPADARPEISQ